MGIRTKMLSGFLILVMMLFLAGIWSIYESRTVGSSVQAILDDNYKSINAAGIMMEALEREDSAILLLLSGNGREGRQIIESADVSFEEGFRIAQNNVTIPGEKDQVAEIRKNYRFFKQLWLEPIVGTGHERNLDWYFQEVHQAFLNVKLAVSKLMAMNDRAMYQTATELKGRAHRAVMPGVVAILAALVFSLVFNYFVNFYMVKPIITITSEINRFLEIGAPMKVQIETNDELRTLTSAIRQLIARSREHEVS